MSVVDEAAVAPVSAVGAAAGQSPYRLALRRLRSNRIALAFGTILLLVVVACLLAPAYARYIAHTGPNDTHGSETVMVGGKSREVLNAIGIPVGPTWHSRFFLGADPNGRDIAVRLLYGGRTSLAIGFGATLITLIGASILGITAGFYRGWVDTIISRLLDLIWSYPALLLGIALNVSLAVGGIKLGFATLSGTSLLIPTAVIGVVYIPYVARPMRGEVLTLREREFVDAARTLGFGQIKIMFSEILPNLFSSLSVFFTLQLAQSIVLESGLSFLHAGVQAPNASWGTLLSDGAGQISAAPHLIIAPGIMLVLTVVSVNVFGDGLRHAFDPRARLRRER